MTTTTSYGTWVNHGAGGVTVADCVAEALGDFPNGYDAEAIEHDYREAINAALPDNVSLCGDEFYGPYYPADCGNFVDYPMTDNGGLDVAAIVASVDIWPIVERHDLTTTEVAKLLATNN